MQCPVCNDPNQPEGAAHCSNCDSDLQAFNDIQHIQIQRRNYRSASIILGVLAISITSYFVWGYVLVDEQSSMAEPEMTTMAMAEPVPTEESHAHMSELEKLLTEREAQIAELESEIEQLEATMHSSLEDVKTKEVTKHVVKEGESLWSISEMYHGHGWEHATIAGHNDVANINHIEVGDTILIKH